MQGYSRASTFERRHIEARLRKHRFDLGHPPFGPTIREVWRRGAWQRDPVLAARSWGLPRLPKKNPEAETYPDSLDGRWGRFPAKGRDRQSRSNRPEGGAGRGC